MPEIARFKGIIIKMYAEDHEPSHIHVCKDGGESVFNIRTGEQIKGKIKPADRKLVEKWIAEHSDELQSKWDSQSF